MSPRATNTNLNRKAAKGAKKSVPSSQGTSRCALRSLPVKTAVSVPPAAADAHLAPAPAKPNPPGASGGYFIPYQARWIADATPMKLAEKSRRVGFTYASSYRMLQKCLRKPRGFTQWVSSRDLLTAKELITDYIAKWAGAANIVAKGLEGENAQVIDQERGITAFIAEFETGNRIVSLSSTPEAFAGKGGDVFLDEADLHKDAGSLIDMAMPCTTWGGQLEVVSAYKVDGSPSSPFARLVTDAKAANPMGWSFHRVTVDDAIADGFVEKLNAVTGQSLTRDGFRTDLRARCRTEAAWLSQYLCQPQDDGGALLPYSLIAGCEVPELNIALGGPLPDTDCGPLYLGGDIGRVHDLTVFWLLERLGDVFRTRWLCELRNVQFREQLAALQTVLRHPRLIRCCLDATGIGAMLAEEAQINYGQYKVEAIKFTNPVKLELGMPLLAAFQDRQVRIPSLPQIREDLHKIRKTATAAGNVRLEADSDDAGHADRFWALALALHAAAGASGLTGYESAPMSRSRAADHSGTDNYLRPDNTAADLPPTGTEGCY
jgi:phage FluMu gp28-like protein